MHAVVSMFGYVSPVPPRVLAPDGARTSCLVMKAPARMFKLSDWYGDDWDHKKPADELWVSPWAKAHYKLRQQEIEIEQCEFLLQQAIAAEEYFEADGLKERAERLRSMHLVLTSRGDLHPRLHLLAQRLAEALEDGNFALGERGRPSHPSQSCHYDRYIRYGSSIRYALEESGCALGERA
jgi:hypothetical protein